MLVSCCVGMRNTANVLLRFKIKPQTLREQQNGDLRPSYTPRTSRSAGISINEGGPSEHWATGSSRVPFCPLVAPPHCSPQSPQQSEPHPSGGEEGTHWGQPPGGEGALPLAATMTFQGTDPAPGNTDPILSAPGSRPKPRTASSPTHLQTQAGARVGDATWEMLRKTIQRQSEEGSERLAAATGKVSTKEE